jgi:ribonuclease P protein component
MISYLGKEEWPYEELYKKMEKILTLFVSTIKNKKDETI